MTGEEPIAKSGGVRAARQVQLLRRIHALAGVGAGIRDRIADQGSTRTDAPLREHQQRMAADGETAQRQARELGVAPRVIAMAWLAGYREIDWPTTGPSDPARTLRWNLTNDLIGEAGQIHNMAAVAAAARVHWLANTDNTPEPDPAASRQLVRNMHALSIQVMTVADLLDPSERNWYSLWHQPADRRAEFINQYLGPNGREELDWRWKGYTSAAIESDALHAVASVRSLSDHPPSTRTMPDPNSLVLQVFLDLGPTADPAAPQSPVSEAVEAVLPATAVRGWDPSPTDPGASTDPSPSATPDREIEP